jgi:adenosylcobyric acid synthase
MGMAKLANAPVMLIGDIDRGGVFASLYGTVSLLDEYEREFVKALIVNKFRGDISLFEDGKRMLEEITKIPVAGVVPYFSADIDDEDSLSERLTAGKVRGIIDIAVVKLPRMSNFTDFSVLASMPEASVRYAEKPYELNEADIILLPGTKNTIADLKWTRENGFETEIKKHAAKGVPVMGICGGYQMLGEYLNDPDGIEDGGSVSGMGLLPAVTDFVCEKKRLRVTGVVPSWDNVKVKGYEIHMGRTVLREGAIPFVNLDNGEFDGCVSGNVCGTYLHGFFDSDECLTHLHGMLCRGKGINPHPCLFSRKQYRETQYNALASHLRENIDMELVYGILERGM